MASRVNRFARGVRFGSVDAYLAQAIEAADNAANAAGFDVLAVDDLERLRIAIETMAGVAQRFMGRVEKERKAVRRG